MKKIFILILLLIFSTETFAASKEATKEKRVSPTSITQLGKIALVIRGGEEVTTNYYQGKRMVWATMVGGVVGLALAGKGSAADRKDFAQQADLNRALYGYEFNSVFKDALEKNLRADYKSEVLKTLIFQTQDWPFQKKDRLFYDQGNRSYDGVEAISDYTPLAAEGVQTVMEYTLSGTVNAKKMYSKESVPCLQVRLCLIDLNKKKILKDNRIFKASVKHAEKFDVLVQNQGQLIRDGFVALSDIVTKDLNLKLQ